MSKKEILYKSGLRDQDSETTGTFTHISQRIIYEKSNKDITSSRKMDQSTNYQESGSKSQLFKKITVNTNKDNQQKRTVTKLKGRDESDGNSAVTNITTKVIIEARRKKLGNEGTTSIEGKTLETSRSSKEKTSKYEKAKTFHSKSLLIEPGSKEYEIGSTYFSKNTAILPKISAYKKYKYMKKTMTGGNLNIETKKGRDYNSTEEGENERVFSSDEKKTGKVREILKGVKYFTKNDTIETTEMQNKNELKSSGSSENLSLKKSGNEKEWKDLSGKFGNSFFTSSGRQSKMSYYRRSKKEKGPWDEMDSCSGRPSNEQEKLNQNIKRSVGLDSDTKYYRKELVIKPVDVSKTSKP